MWTSGPHINYATSVKKGLNTCYSVATWAKEGKVGWEVKHKSLLKNVYFMYT